MQTATLMVALGAALAGPAYSAEPVKDVTPVKVSTEEVSGLDLMGFYDSDRDPRLDVSNMDLNGLELQLASAKKSENSWKVKPTISSNGDIGAEVAFRYTGGGMKEFLWGVSRPLHVYNHNKSGDLEILPFYTHPIKAGGALSPLNPRAWNENPSLTGGALAADLAIVGIAYALSQDGGSSDSAPIVYKVDSHGNIVYHTNPDGTKEPVVVTDNSPTTGGTYAGQGDNYDDSNDVDTGDSGNNNPGGDDSAGGTSDPEDLNF